MKLNYEMNHHEKVRSSRPSNCFTSFNTIRPHYVQHRTKQLKIVKTFYQPVREMIGKEIELRLESRKPRLAALLSLIVKLAQILNNSIDLHVRLIYNGILAKHRRQSTDS